jgi:hydroxyacylglutathione hydrolase
MHVDIIETKSLDDRSYLGIGGIVAVVIDPQRDLDRVLVIVQVQGVRITHVRETHLHK